MANQRNTFERTRLSGKRRPATCWRRNRPFTPFGCVYSFYQPVHDDALHVQFVPEHPEDEPSGHIEDSEPGRSLNLSQPLPVRGNDGVRRPLFRVGRPVGGQPYVAVGVGERGTEDLKAGSGCPETGRVRFIEVKGRAGNPCQWPAPSPVSADSPVLCRT